jgi:hypothetical protein
VGAVLLALACGGEMATRGEGLDTAGMPSDVSQDYQVFAQRCSKCHSLSRPLNSGIDSDEYWALYVERMRRQPSSGISKEDTVPILRFLHYYVVQQREAKARKESGAAETRDAGAARDVTAPSEAGL